MNTHRGVLYFLCGLAGAGKSTLARKISAEKSAVLFCEDQWLANLFGGVRTIEEYLERRARIRTLLAQHVPELLKLGHAVVFDFGGNTVRDRAWIRSVCESAGAEHELHYIVADEALCKQRVAERNRTKPAGIYWGDVSEAMLDTVNKYFQPPAAEEGWVIVEHGNVHPHGPIRW
jgi:predicted kinase